MDQRATSFSGNVFINGLSRILRGVWLLSMFGSIVLMAFALPDLTFFHGRNMKFCSLCYAETNVGGPVRGATVWTLDKSPYVVQSFCPGQTGCYPDHRAGRRGAHSGGQSDSGRWSTDRQRNERGQDSLYCPSERSPLARWLYILFSAGSLSASFDGNGNYVGGSLLDHCLVEQAKNFLPRQAARNYLLSYS